VNVLHVQALGGASITAVTAVYASVRVALPGTGLLVDGDALAGALARAHATEDTIIDVDDQFATIHGEPFTNLERIVTSSGLLEQVLYDCRCK